MDTPRVVESLRPTASLRSAVLVVAITGAIGVSEAALLMGRVRYTIWTYFLLLMGLSLAPLLFERETPLFQTFALVPVFRLVNLAMPIFVELTLLWLPLVYGPFIPVFAYLGWRASRDDPTLSTGNPDVESTGQLTGPRDDRAITAIGTGLPWWIGGDGGGKGRRLLRRIRRVLARPDEEQSFLRWLLYTIPRGLLIVILLLVVAIATLVSLVVLVVYLAEVQYTVTTPDPLIPSLTFTQLAMLAVVMIGFVGFVEELLFRGVLQQELERRFGLVLGLLLASGIFGLMHSAYGTPAGILYAGGLGLLLGILYDVTDSLVLVSVLHGLVNVLLFGVIPLTGASPVDLLRTVAVRELQRVHTGGMVEAFSLFDPWLLVGWF